MKMHELLAITAMSMSANEPVYGTKERHNVGRNTVKKKKAKAQRKARRKGR